MKFVRNIFLSRRAWAACILLLTAYCSLPDVQAQYGRPPASSMPRGGTPEVLKSVSIEQKLNEQLPLDAQFRDEFGRDVSLGEFFKPGKPVMLALVYYECPMMCNQILNSLTGALMALSQTPGRDFEVVAVSFDARETAELASKKKAAYMRRYGRKESEAGWHFLTGSQESIDRLTKAVGFNYAWDENSKQFAHSAAIMVATPEGKLSHYFYGIDYAPKFLKLALVESSGGKIGSPVDQLVLYCYHYDPATGKYAPVILNIVRAAGVVTIFGIVALVLVMKRRRKTGGEIWETQIKSGGAA